MKKLLKYLPFLLAIFGLAPLAAFAQSGCAPDCVRQGLRNPSFMLLFPNSGFSSITSGPVQFIAFINRLLLLVAGAVAVLFVIIGGYQYMTSGGNEESAEKGRKTVTNAIIGVVIIILSYVIVNAVVNL